MSKSRDHTRSVRAAIRQVFNEDWDPLSVAAAGPEDEYDDLISPILDLLRKPGSRDQIIALLTEFESNLGGITSNRQTLDRVADRLLQLDVGS